MKRGMKVVVEQVRLLFWDTVC